MDISIKFDEIGTSGLTAWSGYISEAYAADLYWPSAYTIYNRLWRSDPEVTIVRSFFDTLVSQVSVEFEPATDAQPDREAADFGNTVLAEAEGGIGYWLKQAVSYAPFFGWGWWVEVLGKRDSSWKPPGDDGWRSKSNDGRVGLRRLAFRHPSSFDHWDIDDATGRLGGLWQQDYPNPPVLLPLERSVHLTFGDGHSPEGLTPLEAMWRLERIKHGLEVIYGIGVEHAAGHVKFQAEQELSSQDKVNVKAAARAVLTAQEGNYLALPGHITAEVIDVPFSAAATILESIRYYHLLKLQLYTMHWVSMAVTSGAGAYSSVQDASEMAIMAFNAMVAGFVKQLDEQVGKRLFEQYNPGAFPGMSERPRLYASELDKDVPLKDLSAFWQVIANTMPITDEDIRAVRRKSGILPDVAAGDVASKPPAQMGTAELQRPPETSPLRSIFENWESRLQRALVDEWNGKVDAAIERIRPKAAQLQQPIELQAADDLFGALSQGTFWDDWEEGYRLLLISFIDEAVDTGTRDTIAGLEEQMALAVDWNLVNPQAAEWAREHAAELAQGLTETDQANIRQALSTWVESREDFPALVERIVKVVGDETRAELIASTEATQAYARGTIISLRQSGLAQQGPDEEPPAHPRCRCWLTLIQLNDGSWAWKWNTARDELVCPICRPLGGRKHVGIALAEISQ